MFHDELVLESGWRSPALSRRITDEPARPSPSAAGVSASQAPAILIADDDPLVLSLLRTFLTQRGFVVVAVESGTAAIEAYQQHASQLALLLLDVRLGEPDGPTTLQSLRRLGAKIPAFFMTAHSGDYSEADLLAAGAVEVFPKPFRLDAMADRLWQIAHAQTTRRGTH